MKAWKWQLAFGAVLLALSAAFYAVHYLVFHDAHHIFIYMVGDIAFVPVEVLLVTLILHQLLSRREKRAMLSKLNMVIGAFFSEVGAGLLARLTALDADAEELRGRLGVAADAGDLDFAALRRRLPSLRRKLDPRVAEMEELRDFLRQRRAFLLRLLENPNLLEHEEFTDMLWAVFHLTDEMLRRPAFAELPQSDLDHLAGDAARAYGRLVREWVAYMGHLQRDYPYLFSLAARTNPFRPEASPVVQ